MPIIFGRSIRPLAENLCDVMANSLFGGRTTCNSCFVHSAARHDHGNFTGCRRSAIHRIGRHDAGSVLRISTTIVSLWIYPYSVYTSWAVRFSSDGAAARKPVALTTAPQKFRGFGSQPPFALHHFGRARTHWLAIQRRLMPAGWKTMNLPQVSRNELRFWHCRSSRRTKFPTMSSRW